MVPQPGSKPEFLADVRVVDPSPAASKLWNSSDLPNEIVLEGYTRESWAKAGAFLTLTVESVDGRNKVSGFLSYLQQRQKACYGRFASKGVWVVAPVQPKQKDSNRMECRIAIDFTTIPDCDLKPRTTTVATTNTEQTKKSTATVKPLPPRKQGGGLLGKLVGAQKRTNQHIQDARAPSSHAMSQSRRSSEPEISEDRGDDQMEDTTKAPTSMLATKTAAQVMNEFRENMEAKMLDFDISPDEELKVSLSLPEFTAGLLDSEKAKITMEILKYMVYEAAEEVNEEWIAHKEPSEFMDEAVICVYKEGAAPPEVLEEINKGEMPDELRGQQQAIQQERIRQMNQVELKKSHALQNLAHTSLGGDDDAQIAALNQNKRDRRTMADLEKDKKRARNS